GPGVITPARAPKGRELIPALKIYNRRHARRRAPGERGFSTLKTWRILNKVRCTVDKVSDIARAILALHLATSTTVRL
ncbi:transposase family protein, partial [Catellatospora sp. NPDC049609]|uniref:transposase family protein n=1 Tax=Catellatospora sp. NPDC049609 TaxID=3155505 RepID=UPI00343D1D15